VKRLIAKQRLFVSPCNLRNYDIASRSFLEALETNPGEEKELSEKLKLIIAKYQNMDCSRVPPQLCRKNGETQEQYISRCYEAGEYRHMLKIGVGN
jgi:hypothetical protein